MGFLPIMNIVHARACHNIPNVIFISREMRERKYMARKRDCINIVNFGHCNVYDRAIVNLNRKPSFSIMFRKID